VFIATGSDPREPQMRTSMRNRSLIAIVEPF